MQPRVPIVIPFYKRKDQLDRCIAALQAQDWPLPVWVFDNSTHNAGFTRACNLGLKRAIAEKDVYALMLNQDCYLKPGAIAQLVTFMNAHPRCAIAGLKQLASFNEDLILHGGCTTAYPTGQHITGQASRGDCASDAVMPWINGAAMFVRMDAIIEIGLMDENMFNFGSDSDWCYTARARNWEVWYCASAACVHEKGITSTQPDPETRRQFENDMRYWRDKWIGSGLYARLSAGV